MKIAIWHDLPSGGGKRALYDQVRGLVRRGHTVVAWCPSTADRSYLPLGNLVPEHVLPLHWTHVAATDSKLKLARWALLDRHRNLAALDAHCRRAAAEIDRGGFDLLLAHASGRLAVAPIARYARVAKVLYLGEPQRMLYEAQPTWPWIPPSLAARGFARPQELVHYAGKVMLIRYFGTLAREEALTIRAYDAVLANSLYSRESILRAYGVSARPCYLGVDTGTFEDRRRARGSDVIGVGSFTPSKNIEFVVRALASVAPPRPRLVWIANAGDPTYLAGLRQLAASLDVVFEPRERVSEDELVEALNRALCMAYAPRLEPFGYAALEANACGLPVVAVAEGGVRETVSDGVNGLVVDADERAMARAIARLRDDEALARKLGQAGRALVAERWSMEASIDRLERRLEEVLGDHA